MGTGSYHLMVAVLEVVILQPKLLECLGALLAVPSIGTEDAADIEEDVGERQIVLRC